MSQQTLNANHGNFFFQFLLRTEIFNHYTSLPQLMTARIGPPGTWKTSNITFLIAATFSVLEDLRTSVLSSEQLRRLRINHRGRKVVMNPVEHFHLSDAIWRAQMPKILLLAPTNNAVGVLENGLQMGIPVFDKRQNMWETVSTSYRRLGHKLLSHTRE